VNVTPLKGRYAEGLPGITYQCKDCGREFLVTLPYTAAIDRTTKKASKFRPSDS